MAPTSSATSSKSTNRMMVAVTVSPFRRSVYVRPNELRQRRAATTRVKQDDVSRRVRCTQNIGGLSATEATEDYSSRMFAALTTLPHLALSTFKNCAKASGVEATI
jgi:hypothetical protein